VVFEPGLDLHELESRWSSIEENAADDPDVALSQFADLVESMLVPRGYDVNDPVQSAGDEPEIMVTYRAARETAERAELGEASRADVEAAIEDLRGIFETLTVERP
jgi:hypothetical protein